MFGSPRQPVRLTARGDGRPNQPVGGIRLAESPAAELRAVLAGLPFSEEIAALVERSYRPGITFGTAFRELLDSILVGHDLLYLDPMLPEMRALAAPLIRSALAVAPELNEELLSRTRELEHRGYHGQVHVEPDSSLVFLLDGEARMALRRNGLEYSADDRHFTTAELAGRAESLSPNALLRPVVQDS
ncbi:MAG: bacillithiol biosynthesis cysteine-adding enzyme BshC, partial [Acidobacteria bacterium]|nr:bacillithiol biosynthesis cysteine-adding enzyme BshC [Acidobacteriota bacterium]